MSKDKKIIKKWKWKNKVFEDKKNHAFNLDDIISTFFWLKMAAFVKIHDILKKIINVGPVAPEIE